MARKGLTKEIILLAAVELLEQVGYENFSMRELAAVLGVQVSSLYNHVKNLEELYMEIGKLTAQRFQAMQPKQTEGQMPENMLCDFANTFRVFVRENKELYRIMIVTDCALISEIDHQVQTILARFGLNEEEQICWAKTLFSLLFGFAFQESRTYSAQSERITDHSFSIAVQCFLDGLHTALEHTEKRTAT